MMGVCKSKSNQEPPILHSQKVIIPNGILNADYVTVIEIPPQLRDIPIVMVRNVNNEDKPKSSISAPNIETKRETANVREVTEDFVASLNLDTPRILGYIVMQPNPEEDCRHNATCGSTSLNKSATIEFVPYKINKFNANESLPDATSTTTTSYASIATSTRDDKVKSRKRLDYRE